MRRHRRARRRAGPKQYVAIAGRALVAHTLAALAGGAAAERGSLVVLAPDDAQFERHVPRLPASAAGSRAAAARRAPQTVRQRPGRAGAARRAADDWVLVHDAARCLVRAEWIDALIDACVDDAVGGLLALPVADTLKRERDGRVARDASTAPTSGRRRRRRCSASACCAMRWRDAGDDVTDEASAIEALGLAPQLVPGALRELQAHLSARTSRWPRRCSRHAR